MVVLMEEFGGLSLKRKGADEPELFDVGGDDRSVFPLSCRATKMRRLASLDGGQDGPGPAVSGGGWVQGQGDLAMGDAAPAPSPAAEEERAVVLYGGPGAPDAAESASRSRPCSMRVDANWVRAMLREADSRTVRDLLAGALEHCDDRALAVVPWVPPSPAEEAEPSTAAEAADGEDGDGAAAMDVEEEGEDQVPRWTGQTTFGSAGAGFGEGCMYRWPQHCMVPPRLPVLGQVSPVMWSW